MWDFIFSPHFWLFFELALLLNVVVFTYRAVKSAANFPEKMGGYSKIICGFAFWGSLPWIAMAIGLESGKVRYVFEYFSPDWSDPFHLLFFGTVVLVWIVGTVWLYGKGAAFLVQHRELFGRSYVSELSIKVFWTIGVLGGIVALVVMTSGFFPSPSMAP